MWVFHSVFLIHFPVLFCVWWRIWAFVDVGAAALLKLLELQSPFSAAFCLPLTLHSNLQGEAALKVLLLERKKGNCEFQHFRATCRRLNALLPQRSAPFWEPFLAAWECRKSVMWFFFFQILKRELLFVLYMASVPWKLAMEREVLVPTNGYKKKKKKALSPCREGHRCLLSMAGCWKLHDNFGLLLCKSKSTAFQVRGTGEVTTGHLAVSKFGEAAV